MGFQKGGVKDGLGGLLAGLWLLGGFLLDFEKFDFDLIRLWNFRFDFYSTFKKSISILFDFEIVDYDFIRVESNYELKSSKS